MIELPPTQIHCLAEVVFLESRGESILGQRAVAHVVINRSKKSGKPICAVIRQPGQFMIKFKQSYTGPSWQSAMRIAANPGSDPSGGALFFKTTRGSQSWNRKHTVTIGNHSFYK